MIISSIRSASVSSLPDLGGHGGQAGLDGGGEAAVAEDAQHAAVPWGDDEGL